MLRSAPSPSPNPSSAKKNRPSAGLLHTSPSLEGTTSLIVALQMIGAHKTGKLFLDERLRFSSGVEPS
jgi:hypothetical protein